MVPSRLGRWLLWNTRSEVWKTRGQRSLSSSWNLSKSPSAPIPLFQTSRHINYLSGFFGEKSEDTWTDQDLNRRRLRTHSQFSSFTNIQFRRMSSAASSLETGLSGKVVLVTGASSGIGRYAAIEFAKNGSRLALCGRRIDALKETSQMCLKEGITSETDIFEIVGNLDNKEDCQKAIETCIKKFGSLDVLINSAGILTRGSIETLSVEDYDEQMNVNARSVYIVTQEATPYLKSTKGNIVNVSSVTGLRAFPGVLSYCMSKGAVDQLTRCAALDLAPFGVRCNAVNPGVIITNCHRNAGLKDDEYEKFLEHSKTTHALGRVGTADEVAKAIVFLASNQLSGFITGVTLPVDGGRSVMCPR